MTIIGYQYITRRELPCRFIWSKYNQDPFLEQNRVIKVFICRLTIIFWRSFLYKSTYSALNMSSYFQIHIYLVSFPHQNFQEDRDESEDKTPFWVYFLWLLIITGVCGILSAILLEEVWPEDTSGVIYLSIIVVIYNCFIIAFFIVVLFFNP